jgi:hypothetical protein
MSLRHVAPITQRQNRAPALRPAFAYLVEVERTPNAFQLTSDPAEATAYWWDNGSGFFVVENGAGVPLEYFASPMMPAYGGAPPLARTGDLETYRLGGGVNFVHGPQRPTRVAYLGPYLYLTEET